jgi:signal transduction histidine kinase/ActR/RegA family two-component response regulator
MRAIDPSSAPRESLIRFGPPTRPAPYIPAPTPSALAEPLHFAVAIATGDALRVEFASAEFRRAFGDRPIVGYPLQLALPELVEQAAMGAIREVTTTAIAWTEVIRLGARADLAEGALLPRAYRLDVRPLFARQGAVIGVMLLLRDVAESGGDPMAIGLVSGEAFAATLPQVIYTATPDGTCDAYSRSWYEFTGMPAGRVGWQWLHYVHPSDRDRTARAWSDAVSSGVDFEHEFRLRRRDDAYRWFLSRARAMRDDGGRILRWVGACTEVHALRAEAESLAQRNQRTTQFVAAITHELRNGLAPVQHGVELLGRWSGDPAARRDMTVAIARQVQHLARLVSDLQDASRVAKGMIDVRDEAIDLRDVITAGLEAVRPAVAANGLLLAVGELPDTLPMRGDADRLTQVLTNLLGNAAKFTAAGGTISLDVAAFGDTIEICVRDSGIGIAPEMLDRIFEPFARAAAPAAAGRGMGLGLGLALAKRLVEEHGGALTASSAGPGQGSAFVVRLPVSRDATSDDDGASMGGLFDAERAPKSVLIVDDNIDSARALGRLLQTLGMRVTLAHDGQTAIAVATEIVPDVALVDVALPRMNGYDVAQRLQQLRRLQDTALVAMSGHGSEEDRCRSLRAGFRDHLVKPIDVDTLSALFAELWTEAGVR